MKRHGRYRKLLFAAAALAAITGGAEVLLGGPPRTSGRYEVKVQVRVVPSLTVNGPEEGATVGTIVADGTGAMVGSIPFRVHSNTGAVKFQVGATGLYKGADSNTPAVIPVEVVQPVRIVSSPAGASATGDHAMGWTESAFNVHGLCGCYTSQATLGCPEDHSGCLDVNVQLRWKAPATIAAGHYSGYVKLIAQIEPP